jgi:hypothetical protein
MPFDDDFLRFIQDDLREQVKDATDRIRSNPSWSNTASNPYYDLINAQRVMQGEAPLIHILPSQDGVYRITDVEEATCPEPPSPPAQLS